MTSVVELIRRDHKEVEDFFTQLTVVHTVVDKRYIAEKICLELKKHAHAEETKVYPHLPEEMRSHSEGEHDEIESYVVKIETGLGNLEENLKALQDAVTHHVQEEEQDMIPWLEASELDLEALGEEFKESKE